MDKYFSILCRSAVWVAAIVSAWAIAGAPGARAESLVDQVRAVMEENFAAANHEDLDRLLATMSEEMPNRQLFIRQCNREWAVSDLYYRLDGVEIVKQSRWRQPYVVAMIRQTITGREGTATDDKLSNVMSLNTAVPTTECEILFKREKGEVKMVATLTEPRPVGSREVSEAALPSPCTDGQCKWPRSGR
jgi:hypothetical protein